MKLTDDRVQVGSAPGTIFFSLRDFYLVRPIKYTIAGNVKPLLLYILPYTIQYIAIIDTGCLEQCSEIFHTKMAVGTTVRLSASWRMFGQDLLAGKRRITPASPDCVSPHIAVGMPHVVAIIFIEGVVSNELE